MSLLDLKRATSLLFLLDHGIWNGDEIREYLQRNPSTVNDINEDGETLLFRVLKSEKCTIELVEVLFEYGAEVNRRNVDGQTPLIVALEQSRNYSIIATLLGKGADASSVANGDNYFWRGSTTLCYALRCGASKDVLKLLLDAGCDPNKCGHHFSALHCASDDPKTPLGEGVLEMLINCGANLLRFGPFRQSPLCLAFTAGAGTKDIKRLLRLGASLTECDQHGYNVWRCVMYCGTSDMQQRKMHVVLRYHMIKLLIKEGAGPYPTDILIGHHLSPLQAALRWRKYEAKAITMLFYFVDVNPDIRDNFGDNLLHLAVKNDHCDPSVVRELIGRGRNLYEVNDQGQTPLHAAIYYGSYKFSVKHTIISILLNNSSPTDVVDGAGNTALKAAVISECHSNIVHLLLSSRARIEVQNGGILLLQLVLNQYLERKCQLMRDNLMLLVKYYFLEKPDFKIERLIEKKNDILSTELKYLADECAGEVSIMNSINISEDITLFDMMRNPYPPLLLTKKFPFNSSDCFDNMFRIMANNTVSHFLPNIVALFRKYRSMDIKVQELQMYTIRKSAVPSHMEKKIILNYDCVRHIASLLSPEDTMRLILAFYISPNQTNSNDSVTFNRKRKSENCGE